LATSAVKDLRYYKLKLKRGLGSQEKFAGEEDEVLHDLYRKCDEVAEALVKWLNKLKVPENVKYRVWKSLGQALASIRSNKDIEKTIQALYEYRRQIDSNILLSPRHFSTNQYDYQNSNRPNNFSSLASGLAL